MPICVGLAKSTWYYRQSENYQKPDPEDERLKEHIVDIIEEHPAYGRRRILSELEERTGQTINHERLRRLLDETDLAMKRCVPDNEPGELRQTMRDAETWTSSAPATSAHWRSSRAISRSCATTEAAARHG